MANRSNRPQENLQYPQSLKSSLGRSGPEARTAHDGPSDSNHSSKQAGYTGALVLNAKNISRLQTGRSPYTHTRKSPARMMWRSHKLAAWLNSSSATTIRLLLASTKDPVREVLLKLAPDTFQDMFFWSVVDAVAATQSLSTRAPLTP